MTDSIREARIGDARAVARILHDCRLDIGLKDHVTLEALERFAASLGPAHFPTWVIDADNTVIAVMVTNPIADDGRDVLYLAVDPKRQGSGLGPSLIDFAMSQGWTRITAKARPRNDRVALLLQRRGFQIKSTDADKCWVHFEWRPTSGPD